MGNWYIVEILPLPTWCDIPAKLPTRTPGTEIWGGRCSVNKQLIPNYCAQPALDLPRGFTQRHMDPSIGTMATVENEIFFFYFFSKGGGGDSLLPTQFLLESYKDTEALAILSEIKGGLIKVIHLSRGCRLYHVSGLIIFSLWFSRGWPFV